MNDYNKSAYSVKAEIKLRTRAFLNRRKNIDNAIVRHMFSVSGV